MQNNCQYEFNILTINVFRRKLSARGTQWSCDRGRKAYCWGFFGGSRLCSKWPWFIRTAEKRPESASKQSRSRKVIKQLDCRWNYAFEQNIYVFYCVYHDDGSHASSY